MDSIKLRRLVVVCFALALFFGVLNVAFTSFNIGYGLGERTGQGQCYVSDDDVESLLQ